ncbi:MAG: hypothetical protein Kow00105_07830 [Phycisphaeraceae bacterium]
MNKARQKPIRRVKPVDGAIRWMWLISYEGYFAKRLLTSQVVMRILGNIPLTQRRPGPTRTTAAAPDGTPATFVNAGGNVFIQTN